MQTQIHPLKQRIAFLEAKGLNNAEIELVMRQATAAPSSSTALPVRATYAQPQPIVQMVQPPVPQRDWKDYFVSHPHAPVLASLSKNIQVMAVISGGVMFGVISLARVSRHAEVSVSRKLNLPHQKYVFPHLQPPNLTAYESDSAELTAQFDAVAASLKDIQADTTSMRTAAEEQKRIVEQSVQDVDASVNELKSGEMKTRDELREIRAEVDSIRELLPRVGVHNSSSRSFKTN